MSKLAKFLISISIIIVEELVHQIKKEDRKSSSKKKSK